MESMVSFSAGIASVLCVISGQEFVQLFMSILWKLLVGAAFSLDNLMSDGSFWMSFTKLWNTSLRENDGIEPEKPDFLAILGEKIGISSENGSRSCFV